MASCATPSALNSQLLALGVRAAAAGIQLPDEDIQAALGWFPTARSSDRRNRPQLYRELLADLPVKLLEVPEKVLSAVHLAVIRLQQATAEQHRQVFEGLRATGIGVQLHYTPVHLQPYYCAMGFAEGQFPEAEAYAKTAISLPMFPGLAEDDQYKVSNILCKLLLEI